MDSSNWLLIASIIATMNITKAIDEKGKLLNPNMLSRISFSGQLFIFIGCSATHCEACCSFRTPNPFKCDIRPRSEKALELIRQSEFAY